MIRRLLEHWEIEHRRWLTGPLSRLQAISLWLDSIDGGEDAPQSVGTVMLAVAVDASAQERIVSIVHGRPDTEQSWAQVLRGLRSRGMPPPLSLDLGSRARAARAAATATVYTETRVLATTPPDMISHANINGIH